MEAYGTVHTEMADGHVEDNRLGFLKGKVNKVAFSKHPDKKQYNQNPLCG